MNIKKKLILGPNDISRSSPLVVPGVGGREEAASSTVVVVVVAVATFMCIITATDG